jgi:hypothetical protein
MSEQVTASAETSEPRDSGEATGFDAQRLRALWVRGTHARGSEWVFVAVIASVISAVVFRRSLFGPDVLSYSDYHSFMVPLQDLIGDSRSAGELPLWTPDVRFGLPVIANGDSFVFYPFQWSFWLLDTPRAFAWHIWFHTSLATVTTYAFARVSLRMRPYGAMVVALIVVYGAFGIQHQSYVAFTSIMPWIPLFLLSLERTVERSVLWAWVAPIPVAMILLAANPQTAYYISWWIPLLLAIVVLRDRPNWRPRTRRAAIGLAAGLAGGALIAAIQVLPQRELIAQGRGQMTVEEAALSHIPLERLASTFFPNWWGLAHAESVAWVGLGGLLLAVAGLVWVARQRRWLELALWTGMIVVSYLLAAGPDLPFFEIAYDWIPGFGSFRIHSRITYVSTLALACLAGYGTDWVVRRLCRPASLRITLLVGAIGMLAFVAAVPSLRELAIEWNQNQSLATASLLAVGAAGIVIVLSRVSLLDRSAAGVLVVALLLAELVAVAYWMPWNDPQPEEAYSTDYPFFAVVDGRDGGRVFAPPRRHNGNRALISTQYARLERNSALLGDFRTTNGLGGMWFTAPIQEYEQALYAAAAADRLLVDHGGVLRLLGVEFLVVSDDRAATLASDEVEILAADNGFSLVRLVEPGVRTTTYCGATFIPERDQVLEQVTAPGFDPGQLLLVGDQPDEPGATCGSSTVVSETDTSLTIETDLPEDGWLFVSDTWYPGWDAAVDGDGTDIEQAMGAFRAVQVPAGTHVVTMDYRAPEFWVGARITVTAIVMWAASLVTYLVLRRRRRDTADDAPTTVDEAPPVG